MYRLFTLNTPLNYLLYLVLLVALQIGWWSKPLDLRLLENHTEPLAAWLAILMKTTGNPVFVIRLIGILLVLVLSVFINHIVSSNKITQQRDYTTGALFIVIFSLIGDFAVSSPQLIACYFSVRVVQQLFSINGEGKPGGRIFNLGWLSGLVLLFYFPAVWMLLFVMIGLTILRPFSLKEWLMALIGFISPLFVAFVWYFWHDRHVQLLTDMININNISKQVFYFKNGELMGGGIALAVFVLSLTALPRILFSSVIQVRKFTLVLLLVLLFGVLSFFLQSHYGSVHLVVLCLPVSVFVSMFLQSMKGIFMPELIFGLLILAALVVQFFFQ